jgi:hypothetical protein
VFTFTTKGLRRDEVSSEMFFCTAIGNTAILGLRLWAAGCFRYSLDAGRRFAGGQLREK